MRPILYLLLLLLGATARADKPNILLIYIDDLGWKDVGFMGTDFYETPHLDKLAAGGMIFTDAYAGAANCAPSRACLLSGQYSPRHEIYNVGTSARWSTSQEPRRYARTSRLGRSARRTPVT